MNYFHLYVGSGVLLITLLAANVSRLRIREQIGNGDGGNALLKAAIRAHMNSVEHVLPYGLLMLVLWQSQAAPSLLAVFCLGFLAVRLVHAYSMLGRKFRLRQWSAGATYVFELSACLTVLGRLLLL